MEETVLVNLELYIRLMTISLIMKMMKLYGKFGGYS